MHRLLKQVLNQWTPPCFEDAEVRSAGEELLVLSVHKCPGLGKHRAILLLFCGFQEHWRDEKPCFQRGTQKRRVEAAFRACRGWGREEGFRDELQGLLVSGQGLSGLTRFTELTQLVDVVKNGLETRHQEI